MPGKRKARVVSSAVYKRAAKRAKLEKEMVSTSLLCNTRLNHDILPFHQAINNNEIGLMQVDNSCVGENNFNNEPDLMELSTFGVMEVDNSDIGENNCNKEPDPTELAAEDDPVIQHTNGYESGSTCDDGKIESTFDTILKDDTLDMWGKIRWWSVACRIEQNKTSMLLKILKTHPCFKNWKTDSRTLRRTLRKTGVTRMGKGTYGYIGLKKGIERIIRKLGKKAMELKSIDVSINVDGLPLSNDTTSKSLWPILGSVKPFDDVFIIGAYYGKEKPDCNEYMQDFVNEAVDLIGEGFLYDGKTLPVRVTNIICDKPAKSYLLGIKGHSGYFSCTKCLIPGQRKKYCVNCSIPGKRKKNCLKCKALKKKQTALCFPGIDFEKRTDKSFRLYLCRCYHNKRTIFTRIPFLDLVKDVNIDYMHCICLGCMKKLLLIWFKVQGLKVASMNHRRTMSTFLKEKVAPNTPVEYARKIESLDNFEHMKATEYRQILLVLGPLLFRSFLNDNQFQHYLKLHYACRVFCSPDLIKKKENIDYADVIAQNFVKDYGTLYGVNSVVPNVHDVSHIGDEVRRHGSLDKFSAFRYENFMQTIKGFVKTNPKPLQQIIKRYDELDGVLAKSQAKFSESKFIHCSGPVPENVSGWDKQYKKMLFGNFLINVEKNADNCVLCQKSKAIFRIFNILKCKNKIYFVGKRMEKMRPLYNHPASSTTLGIYVVSRLKKKLEIFPYNRTIKKMFPIPISKDEVAVFPLLHIETQEFNANNVTQ